MKTTETVVAATTPTRGCELLYGRTRADAMQTAFEFMEGGPCPCRMDLVCPLLPERLALVVRDEPHAA